MAHESPTPAPEHIYDSQRQPAAAFHQVRCARTQRQRTFEGLWFGSTKHQLLCCNVLVLPNVFFQQLEAKPFVENPSLCYLIMGTHATAPPRLHKRQHWAAHHNQTLPLLGWAKAIPSLAQFVKIITPFLAQMPASR